MAKNILITGANGQLGSEFKMLTQQYSGFNYMFVTKEELSVADVQATDVFFATNKIDLCINCAAYTAVDKAESERELAFEVNAAAAGNLAATCKKYAAQFIHISTDYVFAGNGTAPYKEHNDTHPINVYAASKLEGERRVLQNNEKAIIIRTSWVYSSFGKNFVKTMLRLMSEKESIGVVADQMGSPTYAADLAQAIMQIINKNNFIAGVYHYCNQGIISWFDFATEIKKQLGSKCIVNPLTTEAYPTPALRPHYSALDTDKIRYAFQLIIPGWKESLAKCIALLRV